MASGGAASRSFSDAAEANDSGSSETEAAAGGDCCICFDRVAPKTGLHCAGGAVSHATVRALAPSAAHIFIPARPSRDRDGKSLSVLVMLGGWRCDVCWCCCGVRSEHAAWVICVSWYVNLGFRGDSRSARRALPTTSRHPSSLAGPFIGDSIRCLFSPAFPAVDLPLSLFSPMFSPVRLAMQWPRATLHTADARAGENGEVRRGAE